MRQTEPLPNSSSQTGSHLTKFPHLIPHQLEEIGKEDAHWDHKDHPTREARTCERPRSTLTAPVEDDDLIPTEELTPAHVPSPDADRSALEAFCLTFDGYQKGRFTPDDLMREANRLEGKGLEHATLDELRRAAFTRQRQLRWTSMDSGYFDEGLVRSIQTLVGEIRRRIVGEGRPSSEAE